MPYVFIDEVFEQMDKPSVIPGRLGDLGFWCNVGGGFSPNEDRVVINTDANFYAVVDGLGSYGTGAEAANIIGRIILNASHRHSALEGGEDERRMWAQERIHDASQQALATFGLRRDGAVYVAFGFGSRDKETLHVYSAGDARLIVVSPDKEVYFIKPDESGELHSLHHGVKNAIGGSNPGVAVYHDVNIRHGSRIIAASDGIWDLYFNLYDEDNFDQDTFERVSSEEIAKACSATQMSDALERVVELVESKTQLQEVKGDHVSIIMYDITR